MSGTFDWASNSATPEAQDIRNAEKAPRFRVSLREIPGRYLARQHAIGLPEITENWRAREKLARLFGAAASWNSR
jgi:hypothetical protein